MSFTGKATYAQLYPSRSPGDVGENGDRYEYGSVLRTEHGGNILLAQVSSGVIAIDMDTGNHWSMQVIPETKKLNYKRTCSGSELRRKFGELEFLGMIYDFVYRGAA